MNMKVTIPKSKLKKIEDLIYAGFGAFAIVISMENGRVTDNSIKIRDKTVQNIINLLTNTQ